MTLKYYGLVVMTVADTSVRRLESYQIRCMALEDRTTGGILPYNALLKS